MFLVVLLYALFASVFVIAKAALEVTTPLFLVGARMAAAGGLMIFYLGLTNTPLQFSRRAWQRLVMLALCNIYLTNILEFWGLQVLTSFKTCLIYSLSPLLSALVSYFVFKEVLSSKKWLGLAIGFAGFIPILMTMTPQEGALGQLFVFSWAELAVVGAVFFSVWGWILLKQLVHEEGLSFLSANGISMLIGGSLALIHSFFVDGWSPLPVTDWKLFLELGALLMLVSNLFAYNLYGFLLNRFTATFLSFAGFITPCFTALFGWLFMGESVGFDSVAAYMIVIIGLFVFYLEELKEGVILTRKPVPA
jgi:EamA-like transporter family.